MRCGFHWPKIITARARKPKPATPTSNFHSETAAVMYPSLFDFVLPLSCGVEDNGHLVDDFLRIKKAGVKLFWTGCGTMDTVAYEPSRTLHDTLSYIHLDHTFFVMTGGRDWAVWRHFLTNFAPMIFKYYTD